MSSCNRTLNTCFCWGVERWHSEDQKWLPTFLRRHYTDLPFLLQSATTVLYINGSLKGVKKPRVTWRETESIVYFYRNIPEVDSYSLARVIELCCSFPDSKPSLWTRIKTYLSLPSTPLLWLIWFIADLIY